jgi:hypothetical protein
MVLQNQQLVLAQSPVNHQPACGLSIAAGSEASAQLSLLRNLQIQYLQSYWQALSFKSSGKQSWRRDRRGCNCWQSYLRSDLNAFLFDSHSNRRTCPSKFACVIGSDIFELSRPSKDGSFLGRPKVGGVSCVETGQLAGMEDLAFVSRSDLALGCWFKINAFCKHLC